MMATMLLFDWDDRLCRQLQERNNNAFERLILVRPGKHFSHYPESDVFTMSPDREVDFARLWHALETGSALPDQVVFCLGAAATQSEVGAGPGLPGMSASCFLEMIKAWSARTIRWPHVLYLYAETKDRDFLAHGAVSETCRLLRSSDHSRSCWPLTSVCLSALPEAGFETDFLVDVILRETRSELSQIRYRDGKRQQRTQVNQRGTGSAGGPATQISNRRLEKGGRFLFLGLSEQWGPPIAHVLADAYHATLLVADERLSAKDQWSSKWLKAGARDVHWLDLGCGEIADARELARQLRTSHGKVDGVCLDASWFTHALDNQAAPYQGFLRRFGFWQTLVGELNEAAPDFWLAWSSSRWQNTDQDFVATAFTRGLYHQLLKQDLRGVPTSSEEPVVVDLVLPDCGEVDEREASELFQTVFQLTVSKSIRIAPVVSEARSETQGLPFQPAPIRARQPKSDKSRPNIEIGEMHLSSVDLTLIKAYLKKQLRSLLPDLEGEIAVDQPLDLCGLDSIGIVAWHDLLEKDIFRLPKTILFEYRTINQLATYLSNHHAPALAKLAEVGLPSQKGHPMKDESSIEEKVHGLNGQSVVGGLSRKSAPGLWKAEREGGKSTHRDIAVIGIAGRYPSAKDLGEFWDNLKAGRDCIDKLPENRIRDFLLGEDLPAEYKPLLELYGGYLDDITSFDSLHFQIAPREAVVMTPQERMFLETVWHAMDHAGYPQRLLAGRKVGVFAGVMWGQYQLHGLGSRLSSGYVPRSHYGDIANRVSYAFDLQGPSMAVDTLCSSSMTAIHLACQSLIHGDCELALAGGVNLTTHFNKLFLLLQNRYMVKGEGRCRAFGKGNNGIVPGEGVGVVMLKPLDQAVADGDHILSIIKGSSLNHGGKTSGYTVPNPSAQAELVRSAFAAAEVDPATVSYIEAHGTGTVLGDPIEIAGLTKAFAQEPNQAQFCAVGSVKSNIGHLEAAAGIAGLTKIILQLQHRQIVPSIHTETLNPDIPFTDSPFFVPRSLVPWQHPVDPDQPLRAGLSSFGAGGSNAHVILEEWQGVRARGHERHLAVTQSADLFVFSGADQEVTLEVIRRFIIFAESQPSERKNDSVWLADIAYSLRTTRQSLAFRLAVITDSLEQLLVHLKRGITADGKDVFQGFRRGPALQVDEQTLAELWELPPSKDRWVQLAELWVSGVQLEWKRLGDCAGRLKQTLPAYPFRKLRHWVPYKTKPMPEDPEVEARYHHPLFPGLARSSAQKSFVGRLDPREFYLRDHVVSGQRILPSVVYLEMARAIGDHLTKEGGTSRIRNLILSHPLTATQESVQADFEIDRKDEGFDFRVTTTKSDGSSTVHARGQWVNGGRLKAPATAPNLESVRVRCTHKAEGHAVYQSLEAKGYVYGPSFQTIRSFAHNGVEALARLELSQDVTEDGFELHVGMLDGALQTVLGLLAGRGGQQQYLPFSFGDVALHKPLINRGYAYARQVDEDALVPRFDIDVLDDDGDLCFRLEDLVVKAKPVVDWSETNQVGAIQYLAIDEMVSHQLSKFQTSPDRATQLQQSLLGFAYLDQLALQALRKRWSQASEEIRTIATSQIDGKESVIKEHQRVYECIQRLVHGDLSLCYGNQLNDTQLPSEFTTLVEKHPELAPHVRLLEACLEHLPAILKGELAATEVVFPGGDLSLVEALYRGHPLTDECNSLVGRLLIGAVPTLINKARGQEPIRIVEVGAGTGGTSAAVLPLLKPYGDKLRYVYTDVTKRFLRHGKQTFAAEHPFAEFELFDLEKPFLEQGLERADVVLATNVLHVTADIDQALANIMAMLKPGGLLIFNETVHFQVFTTLTFGLLSGWWRFADGHRRSADTPLLDLKKWRTVLEKVGFRTARAWLPVQDTDLPPFQAVFMAAHDGSLSLSKVAAGGMENPSLALTSGWATAAVTEPIEPKPTEASARNNKSNQIEQVETAMSYASTIHLVTEAVSQTLDMDQHHLDADLPYSEFGVDSILAGEIINRINEMLTIDLGTTSLFNHPTITQFAEFLEVEHGPAIRAVFASAQAPAATAEADSSDRLDAKQETPSAPVTSAWQAETSRPATGSNSINQAFQPRDRQNRSSDPDSTGIAIIGMSGRFPGAENLTELWQNLSNGVNSVTEIPPQRWELEGFYSEDREAPESSYSKWGGFLRDFDLFDPRFFNLSPREAEFMDPMQRLFLMEAWRTFEDAGLAPRQLDGAACGLFLGAGAGDHEMKLRDMGQWSETYAFLGTSTPILAGRLSYLLNLRGPNITIDTACSASLVALHYACESLRRGECEMALTGGVTVLNTPRFHVWASKAGMLSPDGMCKTFDASANGFVPGEGVGLVLLKPLGNALADGDQIHAVIRASGVNQDGKTNGITAPNSHSQTDLIAGTYDKFSIDPERIRLIECHGTGTKLGDPIEMQALMQAFRGKTKRRGFCAVGSIKSNMGHGLQVAGIAGFLKMVLALKHRRIPPSLHFNRLNPQISLEGSPFYVNTSLSALSEPEQGLPLAAVSSFGFSGTNAHVVIEAAPEIASQERVEPSVHLITLSAKTHEANREQWALLKDWLLANGQTIPLSSIAFTLNLGRAHFSHRVALVVRSHSELVTQLGHLLADKPAENIYVGGIQPNPTKPIIELPTQMGNSNPLSESNEVILSTMFAELATAYVAGADLPFDQWYPHGDMRRCSLPTYPFARRKCAPQTQQPTQPPRQTIPKPLPGDWAEQVYDDRPTEYPRTRLVKLSRPATHVALVSLEDRTTRNLLSAEMVEELAAVFSHLKGEPDLKVVVVSGYDRVFSMGGDEEQLLRIADGRGTCMDLTFLYRGFLELDVPVITAVQGHAYGAGLIFGLYGDVVILAEEGVYCANFMNYGFTPGLGATVMLEERFGKNLAVEMMLSANALSGEDLRQRGASVLVRPSEEVIREALGMASRFATKPRPALKLLKQELAGRLLERLPAALRSEVRMHNDTFALPGVRDKILRRFEQTLGSRKNTSSNSDHREKNHRQVGPSHDRQVRAPLPTSELQEPSLDHSQVEQTLTKSLASRLFLECGEISVEERFAEMGLDSIGAVEWIRELNRDYGVQLEAAVVYDFPNVRLLADHILSQLPEKMAAAIFLATKPAKPNLSSTPKPITLTKPSDSNQKSSKFPKPPYSPIPNHKQKQEGNEIQQILKTRVAKALHLRADEVTSNAGFAELGVDSIGAVEIIRDVNRSFGLNLEAAVIYDWPSIEALAGHIAEQNPMVPRSKPKSISTEQPKLASARGPIETSPTENQSKVRLKGLGARESVSERPTVDQVRLSPKPQEKPSLSRENHADVAIIGMAGRYPGAKNLDEFWQNLLQGISAISEVPAERWSVAESFSTDPDEVNKSYSKWGGFLESVDRFDAAFFRISPHEAARMAPQQRLMLEEAWHAFENAGYSSELLTGKRCGVLLGLGSSDYWQPEDEWDALRLAGSQASLTTARIAHLLGLEGPCMSVDTACTSALTAVHLACRTLQQGEADLMLVGGAFIMNTPQMHMMTSKMGLLSPTGKSATFGQGNNGWVLGEGVGAMVLKPLTLAEADGDPIHAVIRGSAVNQNGTGNGITAPKAEAQHRVQQAAYAMAEVDPNTIDYVECQGTGGPVLGDAVEVRALRKTFVGRAEGEPLLIGSLKPNMGHAMFASGMAALSKVVYCLKNEFLAPTLKPEAYHSELRLDAAGFQVVDEARSWPRRAHRPRRAAVNGFSASGANAHVILEQYLASGNSGKMMAELSQSKQDRQARLMVLSGQDRSALRQVADRLCKALEGQSGPVDLTGLAKTLQRGRSGLTVRAAFLAENLEEVLAFCRAIAMNDLDQAGLIFGEVETQPPSVPDFHANDWVSSLNELAHAWVRGAKIDWLCIAEPAETARLALPGYPFAGTRHRLLRAKTVLVEESRPAISEPARNMPQKQGLLPVVVSQVAVLLQVSAEEVVPTRPFVEYGFHSLYTMRLVRHIDTTIGVCLPLNQALRCMTAAEFADAIARLAQTVDKVQERRGEAEIEIKPKPQQTLVLGGQEESRELLGLNESQRSIWAISVNGAHPMAYLVPMVFRLASSEEMENWWQAFKRLLAKQPFFHKHVILDRGEPCLVSRPFQPDDTWRLDLTHLPIDEARVELERRMRYAVDVSGGPLQRLILVDMIDGSRLLAWVVHHILLDGQSYDQVLSLLAAELGSTSQAKLANQAKGSLQPYRDYLARERAYLTSEQASIDQTYWHRQLQGLGKAGVLGGLSKRTETDRCTIEIFHLDLPVALVTRLQQWCHRERVTVNAALLAVYFQWLARFGQTGEPVVGIPVDTRPDGSFDAVLGCMINMLPIRAVLDNSFAMLVQSLQETLAQAMEHRLYPFRQMIRDLGSEMTLSDHPLFQAGFYFHVSQDHSGGMNCEVHGNLLKEYRQNGEYPVVLEVEAAPTQIRLILKMNGGAASVAEHEPALSHYVRLLERALQESKPKPSSSRADTIKQASACGPERDFPARGRVDQLVAERARRQPHAIAVVTPDQHLTYGALEDRAQRLARHLKSLKIGPGDRVGVLMDRRSELLISLLGVLKSGAAYVPLDPEFPEDRLRYMLEDARVKLVISQAGLDTMAGKERSLAIDVDTNWLLTEPDNAELFKGSVDPAESLAYVIYTSGSTGKPKGVQVGHAALTNFLLSMAERPGCTSSERMLAITTVCFDIAALELFLPLIRGGTVYLTPAAVARDGLRLRSLLERWQPTIMQATPVTWNMLIAAGWQGSPDLKILCGGEAWSQELGDQLLVLGKSTWSMYGPTETTIWSSVYRVQPGSKILLGKPIANTQFWILDEAGHSVPKGAVGELCISGAGLAAGYLGRPELTTERFSQHPQYPGLLIYKTGDLVRHV